jgi:hypothetical protein
MRIAKDGKPFDIDNDGLEIRDDEVEVIQYMRPDGKRRRTLAPVGKGFVEMAKDMVISTEQITVGRVVIYVRRKDEDGKREIMRIAQNGPGRNSPTKVLRALIKKKAKEARCQK